jgi:murein DD-endopeptidase MepM/ murein hydrolase activator NlpD
VQDGDTLTQIARQHDQSVNDLLRWNKLDNANQISSGMLLRVEPPFRDGSSKGAGSPQPSPPSQAPAKKANGKSAAPRTGSAASASTPVHGISLVWPAEGKLVSSYNGTSAKGLTITNSSGTPVVAAAGGTVAYAHNGLRGYGNLVILRHEHNFLSIYAHNSKLLVKQGDRVKQGQRIAEMGNTDARRVELYFELRQGGQPVNPIGVLPSKR